ncbi:MAG: class I SAM-dependent methyltransferase [Flavobacteriia bacterium]
MVGAMAPSSRFLAEKMLQNIDFKEARVIIELGPGTGVFTDRILDKMDPEAKLLVFELNDNFCNALTKRISDTRAIIIHYSAEKIEENLEK